MNKEDLIKWLDQEGHTMSWLASKCDVTERTARSWRSERPIPKHAVLTIQGLMEVDKAKQDARTEEKHILKLEFSNEEFDRICDAALQSQMRPHDWAIDRLNSLSLREMADLIGSAKANTITHSEDLARKQSVG